MCIVGMTTAVRAVLRLAPTLFGAQDYVLTYKFSQDHLELFSTLYGELVSTLRRTVSVLFVISNLFGSVSNDLKRK